jgi:uncharacterized 2Fe-2S/4Fe-4S cluster protein (DUF4445 family)
METSDHMRHFKISFQPDGSNVYVHRGVSLYEAAALAGIVLNTVCGQKGTCGKCAVLIGPQQEKVLACQYRIDTDLVVTIPETSKLYEHKILSAGIKALKAFKPDIYKKYTKYESAEQILGLAVDIGTTTIAAKLIRMHDGKCIATQGAMNPQTRFGDDVISRISYAQTNETASELQKAVIACINELIEKLCAQAAISSKHIYEASIVGNTTMNHLFLGLPVTQLGQAPYHAFSLDARDVPPDQWLIDINPAGNIHTVELIAGFVGADIVGAALATDIDTAKETTLLIDIGTNGEIVLAANDKLYSASCAAGPAFEGARISQGSRAVAGAIEAVVINEDDIDIDVIGQSSARSICGSGVLDSVAVLLKLGVVEQTGRFAGKAEVANHVSPKILARFTIKDNQPAFILDDDNAVIITQKDIREVQLAKAAIRTGIKLLQKTVGINDGDIKRILIAGAFGNYIRPESALRIGILPNVPGETIQFVGNAAVSGAVMTLLSSKWRAEAAKLARKIEYVEIAHHKDFSNTFTESLLF